MVNNLRYLFFFILQEKSLTGALGKGVSGVLREAMS